MKENQNYGFNNYIILYYINYVTSIQCSNWKSYSLDTLPRRKILSVSQNNLYPRKEHFLPVAYIHGRGVQKT